MIGYEYRITSLIIMSIVFLFFLLHASYLVYVGRSHMLHSCFNSTITQFHWRWWVLDGTLSMRIRSEQWKPTLSTNLRRLICTTSSWRCGMDSNYKSYIYNWSHKTLSDRPSLHSLITLMRAFREVIMGDFTDQWPALNQTNLVCRLSSWDLSDGSRTLTHWRPW